MIQSLNQKRHLDYDGDGDAAVQDEAGGKKPGVDPGGRMEWRTGQWSRCSQTCGTEGKQVGLSIDQKISDRLRWFFF